MKSKSCILRNLCWIIPLIVSTGFIVYGCAPQYAREEWDTVLHKAIDICLQCIGLG